MNNLLISIKRFFTNKNVVTVLGVIVILVLLYVGYTSTINKEVQPISIPVATQTIQPRTLITEEMVTYIDVPSAIKTDNVVMKSNLIVGKYSDINTVIPEGSMFYKDVLVEGKDLPDSSFVQVKEGERPYAFSVTFSNTYANSILPGAIIDVYMKVTNDANQVMVGRLLEKIEVLAVKDSNGKNVFENRTEDSQPAYFLFGLPEDVFILMKKAEYLNVELFPVPYGGDVKLTADLNVDREELVAYIESKSVTLSSSEEEKVETDEME